MLFVTITLTDYWGDRVMTNRDDCWPPPQGPVKLTNGEVHVWRTSLDQQAAHVSRLVTTLAHDERARAERFHFHRDRDRFIVARGTLRAILGGYLGIEPAALRFSYSDHGKPSLSTAHRTMLRFNISHSNELALFAITEMRELGVDLEWIRHDVADDRIAERFFSAEEVGVLRALPKEIQSEAFFNCWTRKEAYIKAIGEGLSMPLSRFVVSLAPGEPAALLSANGSNKDTEVSRWSFRDLNLGKGYKGAVIAEGRDWELNCWEWGEERSSNCEFRIADFRKAENE
jgi:4'-phosphopantetheinyl transferase